MRIEITKETEKRLNKIRSENYIFGKGHTGTVRFLVDYYEKHGELVNVLEKHLEAVPQLIEEGFRNALRNAVLNILKPAKEE